MQKTAFMETYPGSYLDMIFLIIVHLFLLKIKLHIIFY